MDMENVLQLYTEKMQLAAVQRANQYALQYGMNLSEEDCRLLLQARRMTLKEQERLELREGILPKLIYAFCDSAYVIQETFRETIEQLQEIFYIFKNESMDLLTDDELICFMRDQYDGICFGDMDYLEGTCLEIFAAAVRAGYSGYKGQDRAGVGARQFAAFDEAPRWNRELYLEKIRELTEG